MLELYNDDSSLLIVLRVVEEFKKLSVSVRATDVELELG